MIKSIFWNIEQNRLRGIWRFFIFLIIVAVIANPLVLALDATENGFLESSFTNLIVAFAFFIAIWISAKYTERRPLKDFGLENTSNWWLETGVGFMIGALIISFAYFILMLLGWVEVRGSVYTKYEVPFLLAFIGQLIRYAAGSFFEEIMSRGYLLRLLSEGFKGRRINSKQALIFAWVITSLIFGIFHLFNPNATLLGALNISLLGLLFGLPMIYTGRLGLSIGLHMAWNVFQNNVFGMPNSGKSTNTSILVTKVNGPDLWTGGSFGIEGGLICLLSIVIGGLMVYWWLSRKNKPKLQLSLADPPENLN